MAFISTKSEKDSNYYIKTHLIKENGNEFIITVFHQKTPAEAELVIGVDEALSKTRELASQYNCMFEFKLGFTR